MRKLRVLISVHHHVCDGGMLWNQLMVSPFIHCKRSIGGSDWRKHGNSDLMGIECCRCFFHFRPSSFLSHVNERTCTPSLTDSYEDVRDYKCNNLNLLRVQDVHREVKGAQHDVAVAVAVMRRSLGGRCRGVGRARWALSASCWWARHGISSTSGLCGLRRSPLDEMNDLPINIWENVIIIIIIIN